MLDVAVEVVALDGRDEIAVGDPAQQRSRVGVLEPLGKLLLAAEHEGEERRAGGRVLGEDVDLCEHVVAQQMGLVDHEDAPASVRLQCEELLLGQTDHGCWLVLAERLQRIAA